MKNIGYLLVCFLIVSCGGKTKKTVPENVVDEPRQWLVFEGNDTNAKHIVLVSGDEEYRSEEALPQLAKILSKHHGFKCTVLFAQDPDKPGIVNANYTKNIPGLEALATADMMVVFTRFRALPDNQMQYIDNYLKKGRPVMGIRTATHAFNFSKDSTSNFSHYGNYYDGDMTEWKGGFGRLILGEKWINHHGHHKHQSTKGIIAENAKPHPITNGLEDGDIWGATDVYGVRLPLPDDSQPILLGQVMNRKGKFNEDDIFFGMKPTDDDIAIVNNENKKVNDVLMPIAWTKSYQISNGRKGKVFATTIGSASDMLNKGVRRLLVNGVFWAMGLTVPENTNVDLVGTFDPTAYGFKKREYWIDKQFKVGDFE